MIAAALASRTAVVDADAAAVYLCFVYEQYNWIFSLKLHHILYWSPYRSCAAAAVAAAAAVVAAAVDVASDAVVKPRACLLMIIWSIRSCEY